MNTSLAGKRAIVTGAGRGIGRAISRRLAAEGACVMIATRTPGPGHATVEEIRAAGGEAELFQLDVTERAAVSALVATTAKRFGGIDILVHAAADIPHAPIATLSDEDLELCLTSILKSAIWLLKDALPWLKAAKGGRVIYVSSVAGNHQAIRGLAHYGAAKAGLNAFARGAALELAGDGITVNTVDPGLIASARMKELVSPQLEAQMVARFPNKRAGTPEEVASAVLHLALPESGYVTGASILVDGGATLG